MTLTSDRLSLAWPVDDQSVVCEPLMLSDGRQTLVVRHVPARPTGPAVLYVHGIQSHPGWFVGSASALASAGCEVFQVARRGSGPATVARGDAPSARQLLDDVQTAAEFVRQRSGQARVALVGVSWGGKLLTAYALATADPLLSLTLVAPGIVPQVDVPPGTKLAIAVARLVWPRRYFDIPLNDPALFTDNPAMRQYLQHDPHRLHRATARLLVASAVLDRAIARAADRSLKTPTTLILARRDRIIDNDATHAVLQRLAGGQVQVETMEAAHTLEFEPDPLPFHDLLCRSVKAHGRRSGTVLRPRLD